MPSVGLRRLNRIPHDQQVRIPWLHDQSPRLQDPSQPTIPLVFLWTGMGMWLMRIHAVRRLNLDRGMGLGVTIAMISMILRVMQWEIQWFKRELGVNLNLICEHVEDSLTTVGLCCLLVYCRKRCLLIIAKALYDYNAAIPEECSFRKGDVVLVLKTQDDGWWMGEIAGTRPTARGLVPRYFPVSQI